MNRLIFSAALCVLALPATAQTILLSDTFERTTGNANPDNGALLSDWGQNDNGLGGTITQTWVTTPTRDTGGGINQTVQEANDPADGNNEGVIRFGAITLDYDLASDPNVIAGGGFSVELDIRRGPSGFASVFFGLDPSIIGSTEGGAAFLLLGAGADASFLMQDDGGGGQRVKHFPFGMDDEENAIVEDIGGLSDFPFDVKIDVSAPNGFDAGDVATYDVTVNGSQVINTSVTLDGDFSSYLSFSANTGGALYDNLVITAFEGTPATPGDFNEDGMVDNGDLNLLLGNWGASSVPSEWTNGFTSPVDNGELNALLGNWGFGVSTAVPEPTTAAILLAACGVALARRR